MPQVQENVIEIIHSYDPEVDIDNRVFLIPPKKFINKDLMCDLLAYICFTFEDLKEDTCEALETEMLTDILKDVYKFEDATCVAFFTGYDYYMVREFQCGRFNKYKYDCEFDYYSLVEYIKSKCKVWGLTEIEE